MIPAEGIEWFEQHGAPEHVLLTQPPPRPRRWRLQERVRLTVHCIRNGLHEIEGRGPVKPFDFGDELPGGVVAYEVGEICPDETALHIPAHRALLRAPTASCAGRGDGLAFVPDELHGRSRGDEGGAARALRRARRQLDFDLLLLAHGDPVLEGGREALRAFAAG